MTHYLRQKGDFDGVRSRRIHCPMKATEKCSFLRPYLKIFAINNCWNLTR